MRRSNTPKAVITFLSAAAILLAGVSPGNADHVINNDLIVTGSTAVGFDAVNGESFGFDTLRLKENNLRIKFMDTSNSASFPTNDWQLTANDSSNGGADKFSIDDIDGGRTPFTIEAGARSHALYVEDSGRIGFGTNSPYEELHIAVGDTPGLRLEQNGSSGWTPQSWDVAGNETNFFVRDVTTGSKLPFRIRPGAPTSSIDIASSGNVGIGTASPDAVVHVRRTSGSEEGIHVELDGGANALILERTGAPAMIQSRFGGGDSAFRYTVNNTNSYVVGVDDGGAGDPFKISYGSAADADFGTNDLFTMDNAGNVTTAGTVNGVSDRNAKENITAVDKARIFQSVIELPLAEWNYKGDAAKTRHLGPMAQDFRKAFQLGRDDKTIALTDMSGIGLVSIQALNEKLERELEEKNARIDELEERLEKIERLLSRQKKAPDTL